MTQKDLTPQEKEALLARLEGKSNCQCGHKSRQHDHFGEGICKAIIRPELEYCSCNMFQPCAPISAKEHMHNPFSKNPNDWCEKCKPTAPVKEEGWESKLDELEQMLEDGKRSHALMYVREIIAAEIARAKEEGEKVGKAYWEPSDYHKEIWRKEGFSAGEASMKERAIEAVQRELDELTDDGCAYCIGQRKMFTKCKRSVEALEPNPKHDE